MAECKLCGKKLSFFEGNTLDAKVANYSLGSSIVVCSDCLPLMNSLKAGNLEAYVTVHDMLKTRDDQELDKFVDLWEKVPERVKQLDEEQTKQVLKQEQQENENRRRLEEASKNIIVTTGDLKRDYEVLGPVYFQVSNKGVFSSSLSELKTKYMSEIQDMKKKGTMSQARSDWGFLYGEWSVGQNDFEAAFFIATEELKKRAKLVGADAVICMRQDIDMDTNGFAYFYLQMYGTAVKFID